MVTAIYFSELLPAFGHCLPHINEHPLMRRPFKRDILILFLFLPYNFKSALSDCIKIICIPFCLHGNHAKQTGFVNHCCKWFLAAIWLCICKTSQVSLFHRAEQQLSRKGKKIPNRSSLQWLSATFQRCNFFPMFSLFPHSKLKSTLGSPSSHYLNLLQSVHSQFSFGKGQLQFQFMEKFLKVGE